MRKRIGAVVVAAALGMAGVAAVATPANADIFVYDGDHLTGGYYHYGYTLNYPGINMSTGVPLNDHVSSVSNTNTSYTCYYVNASFSGNYLRNNPNVTLYQLASGWNNKFSSQLTNC